MGDTPTRRESPGPRAAALLRRLGSYRAELPRLRAHLVAAERATDPTERVCRIAQARADLRSCENAIHGGLEEASSLVLSYAVETPGLAHQ